MLLVQINTGAYWMQRPNWRLDRVCPKTPDSGAQPEAAEVVLPTSAHQRCRSTQ
jgi:hypothetical protein